MALRVLILGSIPEDLRHDLALLEDRVEMLSPDLRPPVDPTSLAPHSPHLLVLGASAPLRASDLRDALPQGSDDPLPILSLDDDPAADLRLRPDGPGREEVLRLARRMARLQRTISRLARDGARPSETAFGPEAFRQRLDHEFNRAVRYRHPVSLVALHSDGRERLAQAYGDDVAAEFILRLASTLRSCLRDVDLLFLSAPEEIAAILPETTAAGAGLVADRFLAQAGRFIFKPATSTDRPALPFKASSSIGVADGPREGVGTPDALLALARDSMRRAHRDGGGRVLIHGCPRPPSEAPAGTGS